MKNFNPSSETLVRERHTFEDKMAGGEYDRRRLIRFGYLSEAERRRLIATYPDLQNRFEPEPDFDEDLHHALYIYIALMFGMALAYGHFGLEGFIGWRALLPYITTSIMYWGIAGWVLRTDEERRGKEN